MQAELEQQLRSVSQQLSEVHAAADSARTAAQQARLAQQESDATITDLKVAHAWACMHCCEVVCSVDGWH